jgi:hypothetical protein
LLSRGGSWPEGICLTFSEGKLASTFVCQHYIRADSLLHIDLCFLSLKAQIKRRTEQWRDGIHGEALFIQERADFASTGRWLSQPQKRVHLKEGISYQLIRH